VTTFLRVLSWTLIVIAALAAWGTFDLLSVQLGSNRGLIAIVPFISAAVTFVSLALLGAFGLVAAEATEEVQYLRVLLQQDLPRAKGHAELLKAVKDLQSDMRRLAPQVESASASSEVTSAPKAPDNTRNEGVKSAVIIDAEGAHRCIRCRGLVTDKSDTCPSCGADL